jgi:hypothetical protein
LIFLHEEPPRVGDRSRATQLHCGFEFFH